TDRCQQLASMIEPSEDAIVTTDLRGIVTNWNRGAQRIFGYRAAEVIGRPTTILIPRDLQDEDIAILKRIRRGEPIQHYETIRQHKDGRLLEISLTVAPVRNREGRITGVLSTAQNIGSCGKAEYAHGKEERGRGPDGLDSITEQLVTIKRDLTRLRSA